MEDFWTEGEPTEDGYYLVKVCRSHGKGNIWVFLARVFLDRGDPKRPGGLVNRGFPVYMDHHSGSGKWDAYTGGEVIAYAEPTGENFERALAEVEEFYERRDEAARARWGEAG